MPYRHATPPGDPAEYLERVLARAAALGVIDELAPTRDALLELDRNDPEAADLLTNIDATRAQVAAGLRDGSLTIEKARERLTTATARVAADGEIAKALRANSAALAARAVETAQAVDWYAVLVPIGRTAAGKALTLGRNLPEGTSDSSAIHATDAVRKRWLDFCSAVGTWREVLALLSDLRWNTFATFDPIEISDRGRVPSNEWAWEDPLRIAQPRDDGQIDHRTEAEKVLAHVHAGAVPTVATPDEVLRRRRRRAELRAASPSLARAGFPVPGADVPEDFELPRQARELVGR